MKKNIILRLDPWSQIDLWLIVILLAADRLIPSPRFPRPRPRKIPAS